MTRRHQNALAEPLPERPAAEKYRSAESQLRRELLNAYLAEVGRQFCNGEIDCGEVTKELLSAEEYVRCTRTTIVR